MLVSLISISVITALQGERTLAPAHLKVIWPISVSHLYWSPLRSICFCHLHIFLFLLLIPHVFLSDAALLLPPIAPH